MNFPSDKYEIALAEQRDLEDIKEIFRCGEFDGGIALQYLREPDPVASFEREGEKTIILILRDKLKNKAAGLGACIIRNVYIDGKIMRMGYLTGLKLRPEYRGKILFIPYIYREMYELVGGQADFYFTTILKENTEARRMLEKPRKLMPLYEYFGDYRVYFCKSGIRLAGTGQYTPRRCCRNELEAFFERQARGVDMSLQSIGSYDLENAVHYGLYKGSDLVACGYVLNQQQYKQYVIKNYRGIYRLISKLPTRFLGYPSFPKINETANCACAGLWAENNDAALAHYLWQFMRQDAREFDFIMIGLFERHPLRAYFEKTRHIHYDSRCYIVDFEHSKETFGGLVGKNLYIDTAFL